MSDEEIKVVLKLFKSYVDNDDTKEIVSNLKSGILVEGTPSAVVVNTACELYGINGEELNQTLHKSFGTISDSSIYDLLSSQLFHYFSTYGLEKLGLKNDGYIYIPHEELNIPEIKSDIKLVLIKRISENELENKLKDLLTSGIAFSKELINDLKVISKHIPKEVFDDIKNREFKLYLYDTYNMVPRNPDMFMKYVLYKTTGDTMYIFNKYTYKESKHKYGKRNGINEPLLNLSNVDDVYDLFITYYQFDKSWNNLSSVYYRYKKVFMTFKKFDKRNKRAKQLIAIINKLCKLSKKYYKPIISSPLNNIFSKNIKNLTKNEIITKLDNITIYKELNLLNYMNSMINEDFSNKEVNLYRIRNRKVFVTDIDDINYNNKYIDKNYQKELYRLVLNHLRSRISTNFKDKTFYIPEYLKLALPTTEKKFIENIPEKSYIQIPRGKNLVIGIHWFDLDGNGVSSYYEGGRADLDLHMVNKTRQFGWSSSYRSSDRQILYSGDVTAAPKPNGASEYFLIRSDTDLDSYLLTINNYRQTYNSNNEMPFEFIIAETDDSELYSNYIINPNNIIVKMNRVMTKDNGFQECLGLLEINEYSLRFYFTNFDMNNTGIVTSRDETTKKIYQGFKDDLANTLYLDELIQEFEGKLSNTPETDDLKEVIVDGKIYYEKIKKSVDINLSLENISKDTIIELFKGVK